MSSAKAQQQRLSKKRIKLETCYVPPMEASSQSMSINDRMRRQNIASSKAPSSSSKSFQ